MSNPLLNVEGLDVRYGVIAALHGVSLHIDPGEIVTLVGSNGAGKTTLLRTISGLLRPAAGNIQWKPPAGAVLNRLPAHEIVRRGVSHVPEGRQIFATMTVLENLLLGGYQRRDDLYHAAPRVGPPAFDVPRCFELFPILRERQIQRAGTLSGGEQQMLAIARALMAGPELLLLDEPSLGLAPLVVRKIFDIIRQINAAGTTIFLVEQNAHLALQVAHRGYVLQSGRVILSDKASSLLENPQVKAAYLGG